MDKYKLQMAVKFKRDVKRCQKRGLPMDELWTVRNHGVGSPDHIQESDISMLYYLSHSHFI